jgi:acetyl-CoA carboxylase biotin carboxyl carrier protein
VIDDYRILMISLVKRWSYAMNTIDDILKLLSALTELPFESMEVATPDLTVKVSRGSLTVTPQASRAAVLKDREGPARHEPAGRGAKAVAVASPIIGMFYAAPSPGDTPFVSVGERVSAGQTLCIVEAMKLMNEIPSPIDGTVLEMLAADGGEVEVGQPLFLVEASEA